MEEGGPDERTGWGRKCGFFEEDEIFGIIQTDADD